MDALVAYLYQNSIGEHPGENFNVQVAVRIHDRSIQVVFADGRMVSLVLYGPRGKA